MPTLLLRAVAVAAVLALPALATADTIELSGRGCATTGIESVTPEPHCTFRCLPGDVVVVEVVGAFASGSVSCGGASAACEGTPHCRGESEGAAGVEDVGHCRAIVRPTLLRCEARPG